MIVIKFEGSLMHNNFKFSKIISRFIGLLQIIFELLKSWVHGYTNMKCWDGAKHLTPKM